MKLYLSSQHLGEYPEKLLELIGENKNVAVIVNALDDKPAEYRLQRVNREMQMLREIGLKPIELDLRNYFEDSDGLRNFVENKSLIWIRGGNVFLLRRAMTASKFDNVILPLIKNGVITYGGYSAALIVACKDLWASEMIDDIYTVPDNYPVFDTPSKGLGLLDFYLVPHIDSTADWAKNIKNYVNRLRETKKKFITLRDGEVYYRNDQEKGILNNGK